MAGGSCNPGRRTLDLNFLVPSCSRPHGAIVCVLFGTLVLVSCAQSSQQPTLAPAPTLAVITPTPGPPPVPTPRAQQIYVVREGDTLSGIAARFGVSEEQILAENPLSDRDRLFVGQELVIPPPPP